MAGEPPKVIGCEPEGYAPLLILTLRVGRFNVSHRGRLSAPLARPAGRQLRREPRGIAEYGCHLPGQAPVQVIGDRHTASSEQAPQVPVPTLDYAMETPPTS